MSFSEPADGRRALSHALMIVALIATTAWPVRAATVTLPDRSRGPVVAGDSAELIAGVRADRVVAPASLYAAVLCPPFSETVFG